MRTSGLAIVAGFVVAVAIALKPASAAELSGEAIRDLVSGRTIHLATPFGGEFPMNFERNGEVTGDGEALGLGRFAAPRETGRWFIRDDRLCHQFPTWNRGEVNCFALRRTGETALVWRHADGSTGRARIGP